MCHGVVLFILDLFHPPVNRLVGRSTNKILAVQMTPHENVETREITDSVTLG